jgi:hypothetical protein
MLHRRYGVGIPGHVQMITERMAVAIKFLTETREELFLAQSKYQTAMDFYARVVREETQEKEGKND